MRGGWAAAWHSLAAAAALATLIACCPVDAAVGARARPRRALLQQLDAALLGDLPGPLLLHGAPSVMLISAGAAPGEAGRLVQRL